MNKMEIALNFYTPVKNTNQEKILNNGAKIGGQMCVYTIKTQSTVTKKKIQFNSTHCFCFLIIDNNGSPDVFAVSFVSGVKEILKTSAFDSASLSASEKTLLFSMDMWSIGFMITNDESVVISDL